MELPDSRATVLADCVVFRRRHSTRRRDAVGASATDNCTLGIVRDVYRLCAGNCSLSLRRKVDEGQPGIDGS